MKIKFKAHFVLKLSSTCKLGYNENLLENLLNDYLTFFVECLLQFQLVLNIPNEAQHYTMLMLDQDR